MIGRAHHRQPCTARALRAERRLLLGVFLSAPSTRPPASFEALLGPGLIAKLDRLDLLSRTLLAGTLPEEPRSKRREQSVEFADFRQYVADDTAGIRSPENVGPRIPSRVSGRTSTTTALGTTSPAARECD